MTYKAYRKGGLIFLGREVGDLKEMSVPGWIASLRAEITYIIATTCDGKIVHDIRDESSTFYGSIHNYILADNEEDRERHKERLERSAENIKKLSKGGKVKKRNKV